MAHFEVFWADPAVRDLDSIVDYVAEHAPMAASRLFEKIATKATTLEQ